MKIHNLGLIGLILLFVFSSCEKEDVPLTLSEKLMVYKEWNAEKFIVNDENTMFPDNSDILDAPVSYAKIEFSDKKNMTIEIELVKPDVYTDNSGKLEMTYLLNETDSTISITDNNLWTENASFTGLHKVELVDNILTMKGSLGEQLEYKMRLIGK